MEVAVKLIKIGGLLDIGGDERIVFADLGDAVYLNGEEHGNAVSLELAGESDRFGAAPAVSVDDDAGALFFFGREFAVVIRVEKAKDLLVGLFAAMVFENFHVNLCRVFLAKTVGELDAAVDSVVVADEAADKAVGSSRVDLQACKLEYSIVSPK